MAAKTLMKNTIIFSTGAKRKQTIHNQTNYKNSCDNQWNKWMLNSQLIKVYIVSISL